MEKKSFMAGSLPYLFFLGLLLMGLPLAGAFFAGKPLAPYLRLQSTIEYVGHAPFSWMAFCMVVLFVCAVLAPFLRRVVTFRAHVAQRTSEPLPWWGIGGIILAGCAWILAWSRFSWFAPLQPYTFFPLWLGYIISINGLTYRRKKSCILTAHPRFFLILFLASALFWWYFEYLNRFLRNWHYLGVEEFNALEYAMHATVCFSTVLPAVISTEEYLWTRTRLTLPFRNWTAIRLGKSRGAGLASFAAGSFTLFSVSIWPDYLFPFIWISPLLVLAGTLAIMGRDNPFSSLARGDWRPIWLPALAALVCGFFWEMWNIHSYAYWEYSVPFVQRFHLFNMPVIGYAGYLPFGIESRAIANILIEPERLEKQFSTIL